MPPEPTPQTPSYASDPTSPLSAPPDNPINTPATSISTSPTSSPFAPPPVTTPIKINPNHHEVVELSNNDIPKLVDKPISPPPAIPLISIPDHPIYPQLSNNPPASPDSRQPYAQDDKDEESSVPKSFDRGAKTTADARGRNDCESDDDALPAGTMRRMHKFTLYETTTRYYIVGSDILDSQFRILKLDRTADEGDLSITEDEVVYTHQEMGRLLSTIEDGNIATGGLKQKTPFWGLLGFIRFTGAYYMLLVTRRSVVAMVGGHYVYQIDATEMVPLTTDAGPKKLDRNSGEARFIQTLANLDLTRSFYFSYSYDITRTLQHNIIRQRESLANGRPHCSNHDFNDMFAWNHYLLQAAKLNIKNTYDWCMPIVHGYVDQSNISVYGRSIYITIIARRSRHFAGARFLKRGANDLGYVANDVETEQIVSDMLTTSFHAPGKKLYSNPNYTSYVQHRGSIPLFWTQKNDAATPKPPVEMNLIDPFFSAAALHFDDLFGRYGAPVIILNLVKSRERTPRESKLLKEFTEAVKYLRQFLPKPDDLLYIAWDMSRAAKSRDQDVIETLENIAERVVNTTGFFHNGSASSDVREAKLQNGVCRTNCIDCLDRTNAAQFVIGKRALGHQLHALGVISGTSVEYDSDAVDLFTHMYHDHGDTIAVQYAGSHLVNTMETYRKINQWTSHPRDMLESFKRYYNNSFHDEKRQEAYNLFLGNYIFAKGQPMLWDLSTDYYLHHNHPREGLRRRDYTKWWTPSHLLSRVLPPIPALPLELDGKPYSFFDDYWIEYYRPLAISSLWKVFAYKLNSTIGYIPIKMTRNGTYDLSPFVVRTTADGAVSLSRAAAQNPHKKPKARKPLLLEFSGFAANDPTPRHWPPLPPSTAGADPPADGAVPRDPDSHTIEQTVLRSLNPQISPKERSEYQLWMTHHQNLPLVVAPEPTAKELHTYADIVEYVAGEKGAMKAEDLELYRSVVDVPEEPLRVDESDREKRRFVAYGVWLEKGRFKRQGRRGGDFEVE